MKTNLVSNRSIFFAAATAMVILFANPLSSFASEGRHDKKTGLKDQQVSVEYVGADNNGVAFHVEFENPAAEKFSLVIMNEEGDVVYKKAFTETHFSKSVYFQGADYGIHPTFVIRAENGEIVKSL